MNELLYIYPVSTLPPLSLSPSVVFTPKVIGVAIARYDFSSRDTRELSLQEGDVVKIYTKSGANGWWRGEVNGRVSDADKTYSKSPLVCSTACYCAFDKCTFALLQFIEAERFRSPISCVHSHSFYSGGLNP